MDVDSLWNTILGEIELETTRASFAAFFKNTSAKYEKNGLVTVLCPNSTASIMLQNRFALLIKESLERHLQRPVSLSFSVKKQKTIKNAERGPLFSSVDSFEKRVRASGLNPNYSFGNFAVSESNQMAFAASQAVAERLGKAYNPLFLWGSVGVGKTHLMQAVGGRAIEKKPDVKLIYCTGEEFTNEIIEAIRTRTASSFKRKFRQAQLFLVDDVQFIAGKESVQMEFFHTFNSILNAGGQVVLTSDNPPSTIDRLETRLRSRFEGGLTIDISPPNFELRTAILLIKANEKGVSISIDTAKSLAANLEDTRSLEGALLRLMSGASSGKDYSDVISEILSPTDKEQDNNRKTTNPQRVIEVFSSHYGIKQSQLIGKSRKRQYAEPRQILMYVLRQEMGLPFKEIGSLLGGRDHSTIMYGVEKITSSLPKNERFRQDLSSLRRILWG